jgi:DNA-binding transcriptional ArsR family regulator
MTHKRDRRTSKRLARLVKSAICPAEDASEYTVELRQLATRLSSEDEIKRKSRLFKALSDPTRLKILALLSIREMCVCEIMVALELTQPTASHHLGILQREGLVTDRHDGKWVFYRLKDQRVIQQIEQIAESEP